MEETPQSFSCRLNEPEQIDKRRKAIRELQAGVQEVREFPNGYSLRFPEASEWGRTLVDFVTIERQCCRFLTFRLKFEAQDGAIWMDVEGPRGTRLHSSRSVGC